MFNRNLRAVILKNYNKALTRCLHDAGNLKRPTPPRLPKEQQEEWDRLQKESSKRPVDVMRREKHKDFEGDVNPKVHY